MKRINDEWIKYKILEMYVGIQQKRRLIIHRITDENIDNKVNDYNLKNRGCIFFMVSGSPPKGYAIYQSNHHFITFIDAWGIKKRTYEMVEYISIETIRELIKNITIRVGNEDFLDKELMREYIIYVRCPYCLETGKIKKGKGNIFKCECNETILLWYEEENVIGYKDWKVINKYGSDDREFDKYIRDKNIRDKK